ncbi:MAG: DEAD/DEAH box helicase [Anaerolineales bacterium]|nr:DEAD/DEAH box helicase [Anaerolineales bacterium]
MNTPADTRLQRVLDLEEKQGLRNRAVMGGLQALAQRWSTDAAGEGVDAATIAALVRLMQQYGDASLAERTDLMVSMRGILAGELPPVLQPEPETPAIVQEPVPERPAAGYVAPTSPQAVKPAPPQDEPLLEIPAGDETPAFDEIAPAPAPAPVVERPLLGGPVSPGLGTVYALPDDEYPPYDPDPAKGRQRKATQGNAKRNPRDLQAPVTILAGVGEATAEQLERLGITKVADLLWHFPTRYDDFSQLRTIDKLEPGEQVTIIANLWDVRERKISMNRSMVQGILGDSTGTLHATWFNKWVLKQLHPGETLRFSGKIGLYRGQKTIENPAFEELDEDRVATGRMSPVYPLTEGVTNNRLRNLIHDVLDGYARFLNDPLPAQMRHTYHLLDLALALQQVHFPDSPEQLLLARRRLAFEELLYIQLGVLQKRRSLQQLDALALEIDDVTLDAYTGALPFPLTGAQERVIQEIRRDLARTAPMTRLLQGDVGSGKTAVAAAAMWTSAANATQSAMLAPTQILAEQHHRGISRLLGQLTRPDGLPVNVALLTGRVTGEAREQVLDGLRSGEIDVVVGTTALIQEHIKFANLGLAIVDEQHRFGVEQRGILRTKGAGQPPSWS